MLHSNSTDTSAIEINFQDIFNKIAKHYLKILITTVLFVVISLVYSYTQTPIYQATSRILVDSEPPKILKIESTVLPDYTDRTSFFNSQLEVLKSHAIADIVFNDLGTYEPLNRRGVPAGDLKAIDDNQREDALLKQVEITPVHMTQIIEVNVEDSDPQLAARIANTWTQGYLLFSSVDQLVQRRSELQADLNQQLQFYKKKHPVIIGIQKQINNIDNQIENEKELLKKQEDLPAGSLDTGSNISNIKILDRAQIPIKPVRPQKLVNVLLGFVFGLFVGLGLAFLFESLDQSVNTLSDIEQLLNLSCLAAIPVHKDKNFKDIPAAYASAHILHSGTAESFRSLRTGILFSNPDYPKRTFVITSPSPMEGKSTIAVNLATVFAQANERVIIVDTDLRRPTLHTIFKVDRAKGIADFLSSDKEDIQSFIRKSDIFGLDLLTCGDMAENPSELLGSQKMEKLIAKLSVMYDRIIFDTPPVLAATDAVVLSSKVHTTLLVVRSGFTQSREILRSKQLLQSVRSAFLGVVFNMVKFEGYGPGSYNYYYEVNEKNKISKINFPKMTLPTNILESALDFFLFAAMAAATLMYGSVSFLSQIILGFASLIIFSLVLAARPWALEPVLSSPMALIGAGMMVFVLLQVIPLPLSIINVLSPSAYGIYTHYVLGNARPEGIFTLSVYPYDTIRGIIQFMIYGLIFLSVSMRLFEEQEQGESLDAGTLKKLQYLKLGCMAGVISLLFHSFYDFNLHITANGMYFVLLLALGVGASRDNYDYRFFKSSVTFIILFGFLVALFALIQKLFFNGRIYWIGMPATNPVGPYYNYDHFAGFMEFCSSVAVGKVLARSFTSAGKGIMQAREPLLYLLMTAVMVTTIFISSSRGGIMSFILSQIIFFTLIFKVASSSSKFQKILVFMATVVSISGVLILWLGPEGLLSRFHLLFIGSTLKMEGPIGVRLLFYKGALHVIHDFFLFGTGLNTFGTNFCHYRMFYIGAKYLRYTHNDYLQLISETGIAGMAFISMFFWFFVSYTVRLKKELR